jgi:AraC family transcriptional regulator
MLSSENRMKEIAMNTLVSLANVQGLLARAGWVEAMKIDDRSSLERFRNQVAELLIAANEVLNTDSGPVVRSLGQMAADTKRLSPATPIHGSSSTTEVKLRPARGGLAPWQITRVTAYIESHIDSTICTDDLAALARLSSFHFCRVFRDSLGVPPHRYVMRKRVERAQSLMLSTDRPLGQIASECGLADQAHFTKLFRRFVGASPGAWRRARAVSTAATTSSRMY